MDGAVDHDRFRAWVNAVLQHGHPLGLTCGGRALPVRVAPVHASGAARPDGLRADAPADPGFSFAAAEAVLEVDVAGLTAPQRVAVHALLWTAGTDDWMDYDHFGTPDAAGIAVDATLRLSLSSGYVGATVLLDVLGALGVPAADVVRT